MQRKGTRKPNNASNATNTTPTNQAEQQEDVIIEDAMEVPKNQILILKNVMSISSQVLKYFLFFSYYLHGLQPFQSKSKKMK